MAFKKKPQNKVEKKVVADKAPSIDWSVQPSDVVIIGNGKGLEQGKEYPVTKETAEIIIGKGKATLK